MINFNVFLELNDLKKFIEFSGEFFEIIIRENNCFFYSQASDCEELLAVPLLDKVPNSLSIRLSSSFIKGLRESCRLGVSYSEKLKLTFYDKNGRKKYSLETVPQRGIGSLDKLLVRLTSKEDYQKVNLSQATDLVRTLASVNLRFNCLEEVCYGKLEEGYVFYKIKDFPNLCLPSKQIEKLLRIANSAYLVESTIFASSDKFSVFYNLYRNDLSCDLPKRLKQRFNYSASLDVADVREYLYRFKFDDYLTIDLNRKLVLIENEGLETKISLEVKDVNNYSNKQEEVSDEELANMLNSSESFVTMDKMTGSDSLPSIKIKASLVRNYFNSNRIKVYVNSNIVVITLNNYSLLIPKIGG